MKAKRAKASGSRQSLRDKKGLIRSAASMPLINPHAAGIDAGSVEHWGCVPEDSVPEGMRHRENLIEQLSACRASWLVVNAAGVVNNGCYVPDRLGISR